jgi:L-fuculose-phosphate aldolase
VPGEAELRCELVKACRVLYAAGAAGDGLGGHLSARLDGQRILIKPRAVSWWKLQPDDLIVIDLNGTRLDCPGQSSGVREWPIHTRIYTARTATQCVLHAHPVDSTLMAALGIEVEPLDQDCASLTGRLPVLDNGAVSIASPALGDEVAAALSGANALLLKNHGSVVTGATVAETCVIAHKIEKVARTMLRAIDLAQAPLIPAARCAAILEARKGVETPAMIEERWRMLQDYYLERAHG